MAVIDFTGSYRDASRAMTLKALAARQNELANQTIQAAAPETIAAPSQGLAHVAGVIGAGLREGRAAAAEAAGRERFAQLMAGGLTPDEMGEALALDPETAMTYQTHAWDVEKAAADRAAQERDVLRSHGWDVDAANARVQAEKDAAAARAKVESDAATARTGAEQEQQTRLFGHEDTAAAARVKAEQNAAAARVKAEQDAAALKAAEPQDEAGKLMHDYNAKAFGEPGSPEALAILNSRLAKINAVGGKGFTFQTNPDGTVSVSMTEGGTGPDYSKIKNPIEGYQTDAQAGNDLLTRTNVIKQALGAAGKTGPIIGPALGGADDFVRALSNNNWDLSILGAGEPAARAVLSAENVRQVLDQATKLKPMSNYDSEMLGRIAIGLDNNPEANWAKLSFARALAQRSVDKAAAAQAWMNDPKNNGDMGGFEADWNKKGGSQPLLQTDQAGNVTYEGHIVVPAALAGGGQQTAPAATTPAGGGGTTQPAPTQPAPATTGQPEQANDGETVYDAQGKEYIMQNGKPVPTGR